MKKLLAFTLAALMAVGCIFTLASCKKNSSELKVVIQTTAILNNDIRDAVKIADEIRKEYSCNCTLIIKSAY